MEGILEFQRRAHEVVDCLEQTIVDVMIEEPRTHKARLIQEHYINALLEKIVEQNKVLDRFYEDETRAAEIDRITTNESSTNDTGDFYDQLKSIKDRHRRLETTIEDIVETEAIKAEAIHDDESFGAMFSGEETLGRFLDLQQSYDEYINLKDVKKIDYLRYLEQVDYFLSIPIPTKSTQPYQKYLANLHGYLEGFFQRTKPLFDIKKMIDNELENFETRWKEARIPGWEELAKNERADLYCDACSKQFYNESVFKAHFSGKKHQKAAAALSEGNKADAVENSTKWAKETAKIETVISCMLSIIGKIREDTRAHVEMKQSRSSAERELDLAQEEEILAEQAEAEGVQTINDDEDKDSKIYNPLNLPLDWDGKPIPYWLWKLHGLGTRYPCEICGNHVYMGRKAFDQHFYEWRHSHGLKCLGIPNTRHFFQVTSIKDAMALWEKLKLRAKSENFRPEVMEEFEDQHGNVYNRKTYEDLKRQGLL